MRFRWKLLLLLLFITLGPVVTLRWLGVKTVRLLEYKAVKQMEQKIMANTKSDLLQLTRSYSKLLAAWSDSLKLALIIQAQAVERALEQAAADKHPFFVQDFNQGANLPPDYGPSPIHFIEQSDGTMELLNVSYREAVIALPAGAESDQLQLDADRLAGLALSYKKLNKRLGDLIYWHYTSLTNGLHSAYPGHGRIPSDYDHRRQKWFQGAVASLDIFWSAPFVDPETGQVVMAVSKSIHRPDGEVAGATALVVPVSRLIEHRHLIKNVPSGTRSFIVIVDLETIDQGLRIVIDDAFAESDRNNWRLPIKAEWLRPDDDTRWQSLIADIENDQYNLQRMAYKGQDSLWVYAQLPDRQTYLFLIAPYREFMKPVVTAGTEVQRLIDTLIKNTGGAVGILAIIMLMLAFTFSRTVTRPIRALSEGARQLAEGNFDSQVAIKSRDEFGKLGQIFNTIGPQLKQKEALQRSLALAKEVQQNLLPPGTLRLRRLDIAARSVYCDETGGDYFDFVPRGDNRMGLVIGDVSGHGISSALLMATARAFIRIRSSLQGSPDQVIADVNRQLTKDIEGSGNFMTLFYGEIDMAEQKMQWVRAGHDPAMIYDPQTDRFTELKGEGIALGIIEEATYTTNTQWLRPGHILLVGTDGIWECDNPEGELYGKDRLRQLIRSLQHLTASGIRDAILDELVLFRRSTPPKDDITLMVIKTNGA
jgi:sigma-B regulation protein RsbU (phosphoserine phosphatase)